jgi:hypothetical protein
MESTISVDMSVTHHPLEEVGGQKLIPILKGIIEDMG